jgi:hypothetical protein
MLCVPCVQIFRIKEPSAPASALDLRLLAGRKQLVVRMGLPTVRLQRTVDRKGECAR